MITRKGFPPVQTAIASVVLVAVGLLVLATIGRMSTPLIAYNDNGSKMTVYANVITTATENLKYRVTVSTHYEPGKKVVRIVDMYSLEDKMHASVTGIMHEDLGTWVRTCALSDESLGKPQPSCNEDDHIALRLLNEAMEKTMVRENVIGNMEVFWSWEQGTQEIIEQIKNK